MQSAIVILAMFLVTMLLTCSTPVEIKKPIEQKQDPDLWRYREYGIGVVEYNSMQTYSVEDVVFIEPNDQSDTVAILNKDSLYLVLLDTTVRTYKRMIEYDYEIPGFAVLSFNSDTSWVEITLDPWNNITPLTGWINLLKEGVGIILWSDLLPQKKPLFFLYPDSIHFYSEPNKTADTTITIETYENSDRLDYEMWPLLVINHWL